DAGAYVGPQPFPPGRRLYGRDRELEALTNRLLSERLVLLYSPSGAGKSSLIQAGGGLVERMREEGFTVLPRVGLGWVEAEAGAAGVNRYLLSPLGSLGRDPAAAVADLRGAADGSALAARLAELVPTGTPSLLVFDQFEEVLTFDPTDDAAKRA